MNLESIKNKWRNSPNWICILTADAKARVAEMTARERHARQRGFAKLRAMLAEQREKKNWESFLSI